MKGEESGKGEESSKGEETEVNGGETEVKWEETEVKGRRQSQRRSSCFSTLLCLGAFLFRQDL